MATEVELNELTLYYLFYMTTNTVSKFHQNPSRSVKWFLYNSLHIYRESLLTVNTNLKMRFLEIIKYAHSKFLRKSLDIRMVLSSSEPLHLK